MTCRARPEIASAFTFFNANYPQYDGDVDIDKAAQKGVIDRERARRTSTPARQHVRAGFIRFGRIYKVNVQAAPEYRAAPDRMLLQFTCATTSGEMVPLLGVHHAAEDARGRPDHALQHVPVGRVHGAAGEPA